MVCKHDNFFPGVWGREQAVRISSIAAELVFPLILSDSVFTDGSSLCDWCWWALHAQHIFFVCDVSGHEVAVGISSVTAALVYLLIWSDLVFPERSRFCDRCWWTFYLFFICITGDMVLLWYWHGMFRPNLVFLIAMFVTSWRFQFMHIFSAYNEDFTKKTSL